MELYKVYERDAAPHDSQCTFDAIVERRGFVPHVYAVYGGLPDALRGFFQLTTAFGASSLTPAEREVVLLATSVHNRCGYCVAGHTYHARASGLRDAHVAALRDDRAIDEPKLEALRRLASALAERRGRDCDAQLQAFLQAGYSAEQALEVIGGVALKTLSNMTANLGRLPLDAPFEPHAWPGPDRRDQPTL